MKKPKAVAFDVIETLFSIEPLGQKLRAAGLPSAALQVWFARILRDAFALEVTGEYKTFREIAGATLETIISEQKLEPERSTIDEIVKAFADLPAHPDVKPALELLRDANVRIAALTNGSAETTEKLFRNAKLENFVERYISIDGVKHWKPSREVYLHAAETLNVDPAQIALVAAHDWDIHGASQAGLITAFVARKGQAFSAVMKKPGVSGSSLEKVVQKLLALPER
jgi:2-haloacid dehalogenase